MAYYLVAVNPLARSFAGPEGPNLPVRDGVKLGRNVANEDGYRFPASWSQISGTHCRLFFSEDSNSWMISDTSTNGTYVNDMRVKKSSSVALKDGDCIMLSQPPKEVVKYIFTKVESGVLENKASGTATPANKRRLQSILETESRVTDVSNKRLRSVPPATPPVPLHSEANPEALKSLYQLQTSNQVSDVETKRRETEVALEANGIAAAWKAHGEELRSGAAAELEQRIKDMEELLMTEKLARQKAVQEVAKCQVELEGCLSRESHLQSDVEVLKAEKETTKGLLSKSRSEASELRMELRQAVGRVEALEEELQITQKRLTTEFEAVAAARKRAGQAEEQTAAARYSHEETQRALLAAKDEIEQLTRAIEAEQARERGAKDYMAFQRAHMEGLQVDFDHALEMHNESHLKLLEVQSRMMEAAGECDELVKGFCEMDQVFRCTTGTELAAQNATQICAGEDSSGKDEVGNEDDAEADGADATTICGSKEPCCLAEPAADHDAQEVMDQKETMEQKEHQELVPTTAGTCAADPDASNPHAPTSAQHRAPLEPLQMQAQMHSGDTRPCLFPSPYPSFPIMVGEAPCVAGTMDTGNPTCAHVQEMMGSREGQEDPSLEDHISLTQGSRGPMFGDDDESAGEPEESCGDSGNMSGNENSMLDSNLCGLGASVAGVVDPSNAKKLVQAHTPTLDSKLEGSGKEYTPVSNQPLSTDRMGM